MHGRPAAGSAASRQLRGEPHEPPLRALFAAALIGGAAAIAFTSEFPADSRASGGIEPRSLAEAVRLRCDHARAELEVPEDVELAPGIVVVEADQADERRLVARAVDDVIDEPLPVPGVHGLSLCWQAVRVDGRWPHRGARRGQPGGLEDERLEVCPRARRRIEAMPAADGAKLVAPELMEQRREPPAQVVCELGDEALLCLGDLTHLAPEQTAEVEEPSGGDDGEDRRGGRRCGERRA